MHPNISTKNLNSLPVLIGSRALNHWNPECLIKDNTDWDLICSPEDEFDEGFFSESPLEKHLDSHLNNKEMRKYSSSQVQMLPDGSLCKVMSMLGLSIIKRSHLHRDLNFARHITMYHKGGLAKYRYALFNGSTADKDLRERIHLTKEQYPQGHPNLMQLKDDFFDDAVNKKYEHDFLHELFAFNQKPIYTLILKKEGYAFCCQDKWNSLLYLQRLQAVVEETSVIAAERFLIPKGWDLSLDFSGYPVRLAYMKALEKVCTTLCSGWFRDFAIDNYEEIQKMFDSKKFSDVQYELLDLNDHWLNT